MSLIALVAVLTAGCSVPVADWPQWGGPKRNFIVDVSGLAEKWPEDGPKKLWSRELGDGYATIVAVDGLLYTMYRTDEDEFTVALDAKTGKTIWEHRNPSPFTKLMAQFGPGPHSTPLVVADRLYTIGTNTVMHCFNRRTGRILWTHDLANEFGAPIPGRGYGCSPIAYKSIVIVPVDRKRDDNQGESTSEDDTKSEAKEAVEGQALIAFDRISGKVVWKSQDFRVGYSSPILINLDGEEHLVLFTTTDIMGLNPDNGSLLWQHPHKTRYGANISTPLWNGEDLIFCSAA
ncbi:MAG: PQQ-binding-like beta-propeller repeat protein, partial [Candidatus Krumholzibacteria bacterium]